MVDLNLKADIAPVVTAGEQAITEIAKVVNNLTSADQHIKRAILKELKRANKAMKYAHKAFKVADRFCSDSKYLKYRDKFEDLD